MRADLERHQCQPRGHPLGGRQDGKEDPDRHHLSRHHRCASGVPVEDRPKISRHPAADPERLDRRHHPQLETGQINLGFIRPVENIGSLRFFSMASDAYLLAVGKDSRLAALDEIGVDTERYFAEMFAEHDLARNIAYTCDDTFALMSLVSAGLGIGFAPQWTRDFPNRNFELRKVRGVDFRIGMGVAGTPRIRLPRATTSSILPARWSDRRDSLQQRCRGERFEPAQRRQAPATLAIIENSHQTRETNDVAQSSSVEETAGHKPATSRPRQSGRRRHHRSGKRACGSDAATAVAYCGLDAWFEGEEEEFRLFARLFRRLMN
jgi:hypothetical protein